MSARCIAAVCNCTRTTLARAHALRLLCHTGLKKPAFDGNLADVDPEIAGLIKKEKARQVRAVALLHAVVAQHLAACTKVTRCLPRLTHACRSAAWS